MQLSALYNVIDVVGLILAIWDEYDGFMVEWRLLELLQCSLHNLVKNTAAK
jgi:hypothetical protein